MCGSRSLPAGFENADSYYSKATGAHELHGDIRTKFAFAYPPLGLPTTDETKTPDQIGRFNHFTGGSSGTASTTRSTSLSRQRLGRRTPTSI
jgi:LGFP repeat